MSRIFYPLLLLIVLVSCQKGIRQSQDDYIENVRNSLKDSVSREVYRNVDFERSVLSKVDSIQLFILRIPFKGKSLNQSFVVIKTDVSGKVQRGKIVNMEGADVEYGEGRVKAKVFNGTINIQSLGGKNLMSSKINSGYIEAYHKDNIATRTMLMANDVLPEVVVVAYVNTGGGVSYSDWMSLMSFFPDYGSGGSYYGSMDGTGGSTSGGGGGYSGGSSGIYGSPGGGGVQQDPPIHIDVEPQADNPAINIENYLKCFDNVPDAGATASITIYADIPVDSDPRKLFNVGTLSPGHTFVEITKENGGQRVSQNIGFYPKNRMDPAFTTAPVDGKLVDNSGHEFNASLKMNLSTVDLQRTLMEIRYLARFIKYDIDEYNCTDFALDVFNASRVNKLEIPLYDIPGGITAAGSRTPNGLYIKLGEMMANHDPEANNITYGIIKGWTGSSKGPCN